MNRFIIGVFLFSVFFLHVRIFGQNKTPDFYDVVQKKFNRVVSQNPQDESKQIEKFDFQKVCPTKTDSVARRIFEEYGAIFAAGGDVVLPAKCIFVSEEEVADFQKNLKTRIEILGGFYVTLQTPAAESLLDAKKQAEEIGLSITARARDSSKRTYLDTWSLWNSRLVPALDHWKSKKKISAEKFDEIMNSKITDQITQVLILEKENVFFGPGYNSSILYSVAPPGASQHISLLAFDVNEYANSRIRKILNKNGWFQTIYMDYPHFTYLGVKETELNSLGLREVKYGSHSFWIPNLLTANPLLIDSVVDETSREPLE